MGLRRKEGTNAQEGEQFDIRSTVEEFKHSVFMYHSWCRGMGIHVCHVKRKNIPDFVFPGGIRPPPATKPGGEMVSGAKTKRGSGKKRKRDEVASGTNSKEIASSSTDLGLHAEKSAKVKFDADVKGIANDVRFPDNTLCYGPEVDESVSFVPSASPSGSPEPGKENIVRENTHEPFAGHGSPLKEIDEFENDPGMTSQVQGCIGTMKVGLTAKQEVAAEGKGDSSSKCLQNGSLDELEVFTAYSFYLSMCAVMTVACFLSFFCFAAVLICACMSLIEGISLVIFHATHYSGIPWSGKKPCHFGLYYVQKHLLPHN